MITYCCVLESLQCTLLPTEEDKVVLSGTFYSASGKNPMELDITLSKDVMFETAEYHDAVIGIDDLGYIYVTYGEDCATERVDGEVHQKVVA